MSLAVGGSRRSNCPSIGLEQALNIADFFQAATKRGQKVGIIAGVASATAARGKALALRVPTSIMLRADGRLVSFSAPFRGYVRLMKRVPFIRFAASDTTQSRPGLIGFQCS